MCYEGKNVIMPGVKIKLKYLTSPKKGFRRCCSYKILGEVISLAQARPSDLGTMEHPFSPLQVVSIRTSSS